MQVENSETKLLLAMIEEMTETVCDVQSVHLSRKFAKRYSW